MVLTGPHWSTKLRTKKSSVLTMVKHLSVQKNLPFEIINISESNRKAHHELIVQYIYIQDFYIP